jgi:polysaccharide export outer membrane protein
MLFMLGMGIGRGQAPTPNTQGLPSGVVKFPQDEPFRISPNPREAPPVWNSLVPSSVQGLPEQPRVEENALALPISPGDFLDVSEYHSPEFRSVVRVAGDGTAALPLVGPAMLEGLTEQEASRAIEKALVDRGMLLHPQVSVLVTHAVGQDVSLMGEVTRPGVYAYTAHHRLLDLIAAGSGLTANAGRLVSIFHRQDPHTGHPVVLDPTGMDGKADHNPDLQPGDTVLVSRAGLVYVIGDVIRPGGFAVDPVQGMTVVQALSLAWGATPSAAAGKAILIRDQTGGRTLTTLNLRRMIRGQDPDEPVRDRDILFVPDSTARNLMNKGLESAIQSAIGVSIYAGLVYSQRF